MVFTIDGEQRNTFNGIDDSDEDNDYEYGAVVFTYTTSDTRNTNHTLRISAGHNDNKSSIILLDSIVYS